jgi:hypothetical protein
MAVTYDDAKGHIYICIPCSVSNIRDFCGIMIHETRHVRQYRDNPDPKISELCKNPKEKKHRRPPFGGQIGGEDCDTCKKSETEAYTAQAQYLYPNDPCSQQRVIDCGVRVSCSAVCAPNDLPACPGNPNAWPFPGRDPNGNPIVPDPLPNPKWWWASL